MNQVWAKSIHIWWNHSSHTWRRSIIRFGFNADGYTHGYMRLQWQSLTVTLFLLPEGVTVTDLYCIKIIWLSISLFQGERIRYSEFNEVGCPGLNHEFVSWLKVIDKCRIEFTVFKVSHKTMKLPRNGNWTWVQRSDRASGPRRAFSKRQRDSVAGTIPKLFV